MSQANMKEQIDRISKELMQLKKMMIYEGAVDKQKAESAWKNLLNASKQISKKWKGPSAVDEIREQREKK
jgi:hypothetical protein